jgi:hypothetical protein
MGELNRDRIDRLADEEPSKDCPYLAAGLCNADPAELANCNMLRRLK